jgi:hypothetical protein
VMGFGAWPLARMELDGTKKTTRGVAIHAAIDHGIRSSCTVTRCPLLVEFLRFCA